MADSLPILLLAAAQAAAPHVPDYFPADLATPSVACQPGSRLWPILPESRNRWYSRHLQAAAEPSLARAAIERRAFAVETLRFLWLRTFDHPVLIRIETARGRSRLIARELSGAGGYDPGEVTRRLDRALTADEDRALHNILEQARLFDGPARCSLGLDGSQWVFEAVGAGGYHFLDRWSPEDGPAREVGMFLLGLTGWGYARVY